MVQGGEILMVPIYASQQDGSYPRPLLVREAWTSLDGPWLFAFDDDDKGLSEHWFSPEKSAMFSREIIVPFPPESIASGIADTGNHPIVWYRREIDVPDRDCGERAMLHFGAVDQDARVWVDGSLVVEHQGGQTGFSVDITDSLEIGTSHCVVVRAVDGSHDPEIPRGKQDWRSEPHAVWYQRSTGIWRSVWMEMVNPQHVASVQWEADIRSAAFGGTVELSRQPRATTAIHVAFTLADELLAEASIAATDKSITFNVTVGALANAEERARFVWCPESPVLIDVSVSIEEEGTETDRIASYFGAREIDAQAGAFMLNGLPYYVRAVLEQGYWDASHFTAPDFTEYRREVERIKACGFNAARVHQKVEDPRFVYWADRLGLMLWAETAATYRYSEKAATRLVREWIEVLKHYCGYPSVVTWVPLNESWGVPDLAVSRQQRELAQSLTSLTRALDPSRLVISNDGWEHVDSDILTIHDYCSRPEELVKRYHARAVIDESIRKLGPAGRLVVVCEGQDTSDSVPVMLTEFGGVAYQGDGTWGYTTVDSVDAYQERLAQLFEAVRACDALAGFCYTQLSDTLQESNGLLTSFREPKLPFESIRRIVGGNY